MIVLQTTFDTTVSIVVMGKTIAEVDCTLHVTAVGGVWHLDAIDIDDVPTIEVYRQSILKTPHDGMTLAFISAAIDHVKASQHLIEYEAPEREYEHAA